MDQKTPLSSFQLIKNSDRAVLKRKVVLNLKHFNKAPFFLSTEKDFFSKKKIDILETMRYFRYHADEMGRLQLRPTIYLSKIFSLSV